MSKTRQGGTSLPFGALKKRFRTVAFKEKKEYFDQAESFIKKVESLLPIQSASFVSSQALERVLPQRVQRKNYCKRKKIKKRQTRVSYFFAGNEKVSGAKAKI